MARPRPEKTLADYVAIAISPVLIMLLVGSLAFFLLELSYSGQSSERLRWILFWFVLASVLVARIAIEQGSEYAAAYGLALAAATSLVIFRLVETFPVVAIGLLGVIWWATHKLTWDCTLIDDKEDASGEGLLQAAGLSREDGEATPPDAETARQEPRPPEEKPAKRPHAPGLWVVYFSLAALPLFGLGQALIPRAEAASRAYAFRLLWIYVAAGMGLLLTTSFLGLRRYLRQRKLTMPAAMTGTWLVMGTALALGILVLCLLLPRPEAEYSFNTMVDQLASKAVEASRFAPAADDAGKGDGRRAGKPEEEGKQAGEKQQGRAGKGGQQAGGKGDPKGEGKGDKAGESKQQGSQKGNQDGKGEKAGRGQEQAADQKKQQQDEQQAGGGDQQQKQDGKQAAAGDEKQQQSGEKGGSTEPSQTSSALEQLSHAGEWIGTLVKWLIYGAIAIAALYFLIRNREGILRFLSQFWANLWNLFGRRESKRGSGGASDEFVETPQPFAAFANPFSTGTAHQMSPEQLVQYTFQALEAWAYEQGEQRPVTETPLEFTRRLAVRFPALAKEVRQFASVYAELAYAKQTPSPEKSLPSIERLWRRLSAGPPVSALSAVSQGR